MKDDRLIEMRVFRAVVETGGFTAAGHVLGASQPFVSQTVQRLEARLGVKLLHRTTRSLSLTEAGRRFLERGRQLLVDAEAAERIAAGDDAEPRGTLTVTTSVTFGRRVLMSVIADFLAQYPEMKVNTLLFDRVVDIVEEGIDLGIRLGEMPDSTLIARRTGAVRRIFVAGPGYLARMGAPETPADLKHHATIGFTSLAPNREWTFIQDGQRSRVAIEPRVEVNDAAAALQMAEANHGITIALSYMAAESLRAGDLVPVLPNFLPPPVPVQLVYPQARLVAGKVRAFIDFAAPRLSGVLDALDIDDILTAAPQASN